MKTTTGKTITLDIDTTTTIHNVKLIIKNKVRIPVKQQRLSFEGNQLENDLATLCFYNISQGDIKENIFKVFKF